MESLYRICLPEMSRKKNRKTKQDETKKFGGRRAKRAISIIKASYAEPQSYQISSSLGILERNSQR